MIKKKHLGITLILLCYANVASALPDLQDEMDRALTSNELFLFNQLNNTENQVMYLDYYGNNKINLNNPALNYSVEELSAEAIVLLSNLLFDKILPDEWSINLKYFSEDTQKEIEEEQFIIQFERKLNI